MHNNYLLFNQSSAQVSKLRFELSGFTEFGYNFINSETKATTADFFNVQTQLGGNYDKYSSDGFHPGPGHNTYFIEYGLMFAYNIDTKWDIRFGIMSSYVGSSGSPGGINGHFYSGESNRVFRLMALPAYQIYHHKRHNISVSICAGLSLDFVRDDYPNNDSLILVFGNDRLHYKRESERKQNVGATLHSGLTFSFHLKNNNRINFHAMAGYSPFPLITNNYTYSLTLQDPITQNYYTELWSTSTYFKFGIGYEFQILKKYFSYSPKKMKDEKQTYIYY